MAAKHSNRSRNSYHGRHRSTAKTGAKRAPVQKIKAPQADVLISGGGTLYVFSALTEAAKDWIRENVSSEGFQPNYPNTLYVEHRYAGDLAQGLAAAGLAVR